MLKVKSMPKITVIMPTYNRSEMLKEALASILNQTYRDFELIVIDDCSSDGTEEYLRNEAEKDSRIVYIRNEKNMHYNYGLRLGCRMAKGEYIARMDDDDISLPERFAKQVKFLDENPDIAVVGTAIEIFGVEDSTLKKSWVRSFNPGFVSVEAFFMCPVCHPSVMMRKSFLKEQNVCYKANNLYAEDVALWVDIILADGKITNLPDVLLKYRVGHQQITSTFATACIQIETARMARYRMWRLFFSRYMSNKLSQYTSYSKLTESCSEIISAFLYIAEKNTKNYPRELIHRYLAFYNIDLQKANIRPIENRADYFYDIKCVLLFCKRYLSYLKYKVLSELFCGKKREHYKLKKREYREKIHVSFQYLK